MHRFTQCSWLIALGLAVSCASSEVRPDGSGGAAGEGGEPVETCETIRDDYETALDAAKACSPDAAVDECSEQLAEGLTCSCPTFVNPDNADAIESANHAASAFRMHQCNAGIVCGPCETPTGGRCSAAGRCESVFAGAGRGCKVAGSVYADGEGGVPDPGSCNTCTCTDGQLSACTEIYCPTPCPAGESLGHQCAECGPADECLVVEHACFPSCVDGCGIEGTLCVDGVCVSGVCG